MALNSSMKADLKILDIMTNDSKEDNKKEIDKYDITGGIDGI